MFKKKDVTDKPKNIKRKSGLQSLKFKIKYGLLQPKITADEFKLAEDYLVKGIDVYTMEKDLLLRALPYKETMRVRDAYNHLLWLSNIEPPKPYSINNLKGGILDGIR